MKDLDIRVLLDKRAEVGNAASAVFNKAIAEGRPLTAEETAEADKLEAEFASLQATISQFERMEKSVGNLDGKALASLAHGVAKAAANSLPTAETGGFRTFGEQLRAMFHADPRAANRRDDRLWAINPQNDAVANIINGGIVAAGTGMSEGIAADGGLLVQQDFIAGLLEPMYETGELLRRVSRQPVGANSNGIRMYGVAETSRANGSRWGGIQAYWLAEGQLKTPSKPKFRTMDMNLKKLAALCYATDELLQDAVALEGFIRRIFPVEMQFTVEDSFVNGTGVGMPLGFLNSGAAVTVAAEAGQAAGTVVMANILKMWARMPSRNRANAVWLTNSDIEAQFLGLKNDAGQPVYMPPGGLSGAPYATLLGRPVVSMEYTAAIGTPGDIILADMSDYTIIEKGGIDQASSIHVRFIYDETVFRFVYRIDGMPASLVPVAPRNSANPQSPYVILAAR